MFYRGEKMPKQKVFRITLDVCIRTQKKSTGQYTYKMLHSASREMDVFNNEEVEKFWETYIPLVFNDANEEKDLERKENND
jgi:hypothetical protein